MANTAKAALTLQPNPGLSKIEIDGVDLAEACISLALHLDAIGEPHLLLDILLPEVGIDGEIHVDIPEHSRQALIALGWTPPAEAGEG